MRRVLVATNNAKKRKELDSILHALGVETVTPAELGINCEVEETGETFEENAVLKAKTARFCPVFRVADDSGLMVDAPGAVQAFIPRATAVGLDDAGRTLRLLSELKGVTARGAKFVSAIAYYANDGDYFHRARRVRAGQTLRTRLMAQAVSGTIRYFMCRNTA